MAERLRVVMEFSKSKEREMLLYKELSKYSNPQAAAKDMLFGVIPLPAIEEEKEK